MNSTSVDYWFPIEQQRKYVSSLKQLRAGLTRCRAEYFVKLWAYLLLKQQQELGKPLQQPLTELDVPEGFVPCTHREAYELFYGETDRGSDRAAGMMIDKLVSLGLIEKDFDGNTTCIRIRSPLPNFHDTAQVEPIQIVPDAFNPRTDAIPVAIFFVRFYNLMNRKPNPQRTAKILRDWAKQYPIGMRVLRRCDNQHPVGFYVYHPVAPESEQNFFLPPRKSFHLSTASETDPIQIAVPGDLNCTSIFIRAWLIDSDHKQQINVCQFLEDGKKTLIRMLADFPNLCDIYALPMQPDQEKLASALGFQKTSIDPAQPLCWMYMPLDKLLACDMEQAVSVLKLDQ
ncbi:MAG: hypothetical protein PUP93_17890 [Rhizonema sp. NSF051]|nr:hypothetical protein [Rhizonema sp. NSF051]